MADVDAALALDRLDQHAGDRTVDRAAHRIEIAPGHVPESLGHRLERLVLGRLTGGRERGQRPPVEAPEGADDRVAATTAVLAGELDGALVGFGARSW